MRRITFKLYMGGRSGS